MPKRMYLARTRTGYGPVYIEDPKPPVLRVLYFTPVPQWVRDRDNDPRPVRRCGWLAYQREMHAAR